LTCPHDGRKYSVQDFDLRIDSCCKKCRAITIEINQKPSAFTNEITDIFISMEAVKAIMQIWDLFKGIGTKVIHDI
jgi:hypothetical protein